MIRTEPDDGGATCISHAEREALLARLAGAQGGVVSSAQLLASGFASSTITDRVRSARLLRIAPHVYAVGHAAVPRRGRLFAALLSVGDDAVITGRASLELQRAVPASESAIDVLVTRRHRPIVLARVRQTRVLHADDVRSVDGLRVTSVARALLDLSRDVDPSIVANVMHEVAYRRRLSVRGIEQVIDRHPTSPARRVLASALAMHRHGSAGSRSALERRALAMLLRGGLRTPERNVKVRGAAETWIEVDMLWRPEHVCLEIDGDGHGRARTRRDDRARDTVLRAAGLRVVRVTALDIDLDPQGVVARLSLTLQQTPLQEPSSERVPMECCVPSSERDSVT